MRKKETQDKRPILTIGDLVAALLCFAGFLVAGLGSYYLSVGEFVSAQLAVVYTALAGVGAVTMLLRLYRFAALYYTGCVLGGVVCSAVAGLKGDFAPTAGVIAACFLIAVFALFGVIAQWRAFRKKLERRKARRAEEKAEQEAAREAAAQPDTLLTGSQTAPEEPRPASNGAEASAVPTEAGKEEQ